MRPHATARLDLLLAVFVLGHCDPAPATPHPADADGALSTALHLDDACLRADGELGPMCSSVLLQVVTEKKQKHGHRALAPERPSGNVLTDLTGSPIESEVEEVERYHRAANFYKVIMWVALSLLLVMAAWSLYYCRRSEAAPTDHIVTNSELRANSSGLGYRRSMRTEDVDESRQVAWGSTVVGIDLGNGWLQVGEHYLPMKVNGKQVITPSISAPGSTALTWQDTASPQRRQNSASPVRGSSP